MSDPRLIEAQKLTADGRHVFVLSPTKRPLANCSTCKKSSNDATHRNACTCLTCHGHYAATTDIDRVAAILRKHPTGLLSLRTGAISGVVVVDIDPRNGGALQAALMPPTLAVATGSDGLHVYYTHPGGHIPSRPLPGFSGIDIKADGGYVVLPPSLHPETKKPYRWAPKYPIASLPQALHELMLTTTQPAQTLQARPINLMRSKEIKHPDKLLDSILRRVIEAPEGLRRRTLFGAAKGVARMTRSGTLTSTDGIAALTQAALTASSNGHPLTSAQIHSAITAGLRAEGVNA